MTPLLTAATAALSLTLSAPPLTAPHPIPRHGVAHIALLSPPPSLLAGIESTGVATTVGGGGGGGGVTIGTTAITSGTSGRILFDNAGVVGEDADLTFTGGDTLTATKIAGTTFTGTNVATGRTTFGSAADVANAVDLGETAGRITFEGPTADANETRFGATDPTVGDQVILLPDLAAAATDTLMTRGITETVTGAKAFTGSNTVGTNGWIWSAAATFNTDVQVRFGSGTNSIMRYDSTNTPDTLMIGVPSSSNTLRVTELGDINTDTNNGACGTSACTDPGIVINEHGASTTGYAHLSGGGFMVLRANKTLAEGSATATWRIPVTAETGTSGVFYYTVFATDGSTPQVRSGRLIFSVTNDGGVETCVLGTPEETDNTPTGTLTVTVTCNTAPSNAVDLELNPTSSLSQTTLESYTGVELFGPGQPLPQ